MNKMKVLVRLEKALASQDADVRHAAVSALDRVGGEKALALIVKALADQDADVRRKALYALGNVAKLPDYN